VELNFISTGDWKYLHMIAVQSAIATQHVSQINIHYTIKPSGAYFNQIASYVILKEIVPTDVPALRGKTPAFQVTHLKDFIMWKLLDEDGGIVLDLDVICIKDISGLLGDGLVTASLDVEDYHSTPFPFNSSVVIAVAGNPIVKAIRRFTDAAMNMDNLSWGLTGPVILSVVALENLDRGFKITPHLVFNPYGGQEISSVYDENAELNLPEEACTMHLYAKVSSPKFDSIDANWVKGSQSLLARTIKDILPESTWNISPPFDESGYLNARGKHYKGLFDAIRIAKPKTILEIGTSSGETAIGLIWVAGQAWGEGNIKYFGIDLFENGKPAQWELEFSGNYVPPKMAAVQARLETETQAAITLVAMDSRELPSKAPESWPPIDLIYVDGGHSLETVKHDWGFAQACMHEGTVIIFDDYFPEMSFIGAKLTVDGIDRSKFDVDIRPETDDYMHQFGRLRTQLAVVRLKRPDAPRTIKHEWAKEIMDKVVGS
jgi:hypothetical protein